MPFEIAPKEVSVADKLAALIEAGRAAHPNLLHARGNLHDGKKACAMGFALLGAGLVPAMMEAPDELAAAMGVDAKQLRNIARRVVEMNDHSHASMEEIVEALRGDSLPPAPLNMPFDLEGGWIKTYAKVIAQQQGSIVKLVIDEYYGQMAKFDPVVFMPKVMETVELPFKAPAKKVRNSTKTGKCWPVAKHAYA